MLDVLIAGAGPAGSIAALQLARAGARVVIVDRASFPRATACAGLLDKVALDHLASLGLEHLTTGAARISRTLVTGPHAQWTAEPTDGTEGAVVDRSRFDRQLLEAAVKAGARFEDRVVVRRPLVDERSGLIRGVVFSRSGSNVEVRMPAVLTIGADGRHSRLARSAGLRLAGGPRRWAFGGEIATDGTAIAGDRAELHVRDGWYVGVVPAGNGAARLIVVVPAHAGGRTAGAVIRQAVARDGELMKRFGQVSLQIDMPVAGPLAVNVPVPGVRGLLLAGDGAGAVEPLTGDGLMFAIVGGDLAAAEAGRVIVDGSFAAAPWRLAAARREAFGPRVRLNRWAARLADSPFMFDVASRWATRFPAFARRVVNYARQRAEQA